jgi:hypothetical protein
MSAQPSNVVRVDFNRGKRAAKQGWSHLRKLRFTRTVLLAGWIGTALGVAWEVFVR